MNRRDFLRLLGVATASAAVPAVLVPERRIWQVPSNAPVGSRIDRGWGFERWLDYGDQELGVLVEYTSQNMGWVRLGRDVKRDAATSGFGGLSFVQHEPRRMPTLGGDRVRELRGDGTVVLENGEVFDPANPGALFGTKPSQLPAAGEPLTLERFKAALRRVHNHSDYFVTDEELKAMPKAVRSRYGV